MQLECLCHECLGLFLPVVAAFPISSRPQFGPFQDLSFSQLHRPKVAWKEKHKSKHKRRKGLLSDSWILLKAVHLRLGSWPWYFCGRPQWVHWRTAAVQPPGPFFSDRCRRCFLRHRQVCSHTGFMWAFQSWWRQMLDFTKIMRSMIFYGGRLFVAVSLRGHQYTEWYILDVKDYIMYNKLTYIKQYMYIFFSMHILKKSKNRIKTYISMLTKLPALKIDIWMHGLMDR